MNTPIADPRGQADARERILIAAEQLFAQKGIEKTSTREITAQAGVNVASVNYYFRSKDALAEEIFARLAERATTMRLADLSAYLQAAQASGEPLRLEALVACFLRPYFEPVQTGRLFARFILQHRLQPSEMTKRVYDQHLDPFAREFIDALCLADPLLPRTEWIWRYTLMVSTVVLAVTDTTADNRLVVLSGGLMDATQGEEMKDSLGKFLRAALSGQTAG